MLMLYNFDISVAILFYIKKSKGNKTRGIIIQVKSN